jgi:hypothetical protein
MIRQKLAALAFSCLALAGGQVARAQSHQKVSFKASNGQEIVVDTAAGRLITPHSSPTELYDCGDRFEVCLSDNRAFAFSYFRNCDDFAPMENYKRLRFQPKIISVVHGNLWMVFDASPNFMFHYVERAGLIGIYVGQSPSFDFRTLLRKRDLKISDYDALEYGIVPPATMAVCD